MEERQADSYAVIAAALKAEQEKAALLRQRVLLTRQLRRARKGD